MTIQMDYLNANPDVLKYFDQNANSLGMTANQFAEKHYNDFGRNEGRTWGTPTTTTNNPAQNLFQPGLYQNSYSGIGQDNNKSLMEGLLPKLKDSFSNYGANIDKSTQAAKEAFGSMNKRAMKTDLQGILNDIASKNMLRSSIVTDAIAKGSTALTGANSDKAFQAAMQNSILKAEEPTLLAKIASLGNYSQSSDPLEPYKLMAQYDWAMS